jgi:RimJ/RimL family protein N-acetyltransferase
MLKLAMKYAFVTTGAEAVQLNVFSENARAMKSYIKAGFQIRKTTDKAFAFKDEVWGRCNMVVKREQI